MLSNLCRSLNSSNTADFDIGSIEEALVCFLTQTIQVLLHLNNDWGAFIVLNEQCIPVSFDELLDCLTEDT